MIYVCVKHFLVLIQNNKMIKTDSWRFKSYVFLGAPMHLCNWLCPLVGRLVGNAFVRRSTWRIYLALFRIILASFHSYICITSDAGSQCRCGRMGRGIQPLASPKPHPQPPSNTLTHKQYQLQHPKYAFFAFSTWAWQLKCDGPTNRRTDGPRH